MISYCIIFYCIIFIFIFIVIIIIIFILNYIISYHIISITKLPNSPSKVPESIDWSALATTCSALQRHASSIDQLAWRFELPRASQQRRANALQRRASSIDQLARRFELPRARQQRRANALQRKRSAASGQLDRFSQGGIRCATDLPSSIVPSRPASTRDQPND